MTDIRIRAVSKSDVAKLEQISKKTFIDTYYTDDCAADLEQHINEKFSPEQLTKEMCNPETLFFFAETENKVLGYLKLNIAPLQINNGFHHSVEIERIYIDANFQGISLGKELLFKAIEIAKEHKASLVWLSVWEENHKAIEFYKRKGFIAFDKKEFIMGEEQATNILMKLEII